MSCSAYLGRSRINTSMKICSTCKISKALDSFYSGYARCKDCHKIATRKWGRENVMKRRATINAWQAKNPSASKTIRAEAKRAWKSQNKAKTRAQSVISNALRDRKLTPCPCRVCRKLYNQEVKAHAHHCDYNKPLEVMWLCPKHHKAWHRVFLAEQPL